MSSSIIFGLKFDCLLKLMLGTLILAGVTKNESPNYPAFSLERLLLHTFPNLLYCFHYISFFKFSKSPVHVRIVTLSIEFFCLSTDIQRLLINHVDIEKECQVVVSVRMLVVKKNAFLQVLYCMLIVANLEVGKTKVVVKLRIFIIDSFRLLKGSNCKHILTLFVHGDTIIEESHPRTRIVLLQVLLANYCKTVPILGL